MSRSHGQSRRQFWRARVNESVREKNREWTAVVTQNNRGLKGSGGTGQGKEDKLFRQEVNRFL